MGMTLKLSIQNFDDFKSVDDNLFKQYYWVSKNDFFKLYSLIAPPDQVNNELFLKLLLFFLYIKKYPTMRSLSIECNIDQYTAKRYLDEIIGLLSFHFLLNTTISQLNRISSEPISIKSYNNPISNKKYRVNGFVSATFFPISTYSTCGDQIKYYSQKHQTNGIKVLSIVNINNGGVSFVSKNSYFGSTRDFNIALESGVCDVFQLEEDERILGDFGFSNRPDKFICSNIVGSEDNLNNGMGAYHIETPIDKAKKSLDILNEGYRGDTKEFEKIIYIIFNLLNLFLKDESILKAKEVLLKNGTSSELLEYGGKPISFDSRMFLRTPLGKNVVTLPDNQVPTVIQSENSSSLSTRVTFSSLPKSIIAITPKESEITKPLVDPTTTSTISTTTTTSTTSNTVIITTTTIDKNPGGFFRGPETSSSIPTVASIKGINVNSVPKVAKTSNSIDRNVPNSFFRRIDPTPSFRVNLPVNVAAPSNLSDHRKFLRSAYRG
ncbi:hypothetical protein DICPUDRAFT_83107 [Dictyostelium purpureum]|uniref:DDE Tnp4 domain-containing protein n=1 Tax=Dictyostelium purpureum TaxID=5786 RepID=F0ZYJ8_DICPU|nr:uncharacterized protein DICPUDRAFT_83107 [Dictyostelium purpureum]EGC30984.1 hypothetical protein DICPUDRAFT_83107 [Dictyostelium purpureum]|eukprot:XP_003292485.1 hypothetical protein DICPUDRAFT_83107 [Dictyostelium purpureum]